MREAPALRCADIAPSRRRRGRGVREAVAIPARCIEPSSGDPPEGRTRRDLPRAVRPRGGGSTWGCSRFMSHTATRSTHEDETFAGWILLPSCLRERRVWARTRPEISIERACARSITPSASLVRHSRRSHSPSRSGASPSPSASGPGGRSRRSQPARPRFGTGTGTSTGVCPRWRDARSSANTTSNALTTQSANSAQ